MRMKCSPIPVVLLTICSFLSSSSCNPQGVTHGLSYPGDGCADYTLKHSISTTLDTSLESITASIGNPLNDPEDLAYMLFGQRYWKLQQITPSRIQVYFTYGGYILLEVGYWWDNSVIGHFDSNFDVVCVAFWFFSWLCVCRYACLRSRLGWCWMFCRHMEWISSKRTCQVWFMCRKFLPVVYAMMHIIRKQELPHCSSQFNMLLALCN